MKVEIRAYGIEEAIREIVAVGHRADDLTIPYEYIANDFHHVMARNFESEGQYSGPTWRPLTEKWLLHKIRVGKDNGILRFNEDLMRSLTRRNAVGSVHTVRHDTLIVGTRIFYGEFHVTGTEFMPKRNFMRIPIWDRKRWTKIIEHYIRHGSL